MELSPTDARLKSIGSIDLFTTDQKYDFKLTDILRKRQRPLLMLLDPDGKLVFSSAPSSVAGPRPVDEVYTQRVIEEAFVETQRLFKQQQPVASVVEQLTINKPGERCAVVILGNEFFCLRLFALQNSNGQRGELYAALVEPISKPKPQKDESLDAAKARALARLSKRELDVLGALMCGATDKEIAIKLEVSVETVRAYLKSIRAKLGAKTRTAIVSIVHGLQSEGPTATP